jgi:hypothetical protein
MPNLTLTEWLLMVWEALDEEDQVIRESKLEQANAFLKSCRNVYSRFGSGKVR